jgi:hypothetical protein
MCQRRGGSEPTSTRLLKQQDASHKPPTTVCANAIWPTVTRAGNSTASPENRAMDVVTWSALSDMGEVRAYVPFSGS